MSLTLLQALKLLPLKKIKKNSVVLGHPSGMWLNDGNRNGFPV